MSWRESFSEQLVRRRALELQLVPLFNAFEEAAQRASVLDADPDTLESSEKIVSTEKHREIEQLLRHESAELSKKLATTTKQLLSAQERQRNMAEEQYMRTHAVEALHDEILALTLQLNLSEQRVSSLERKYES